MVSLHSSMLIMEESTYRRPVTVQWLGSISVKHYSVKPARLADYDKLNGAVDNTGNETEDDADD
jgi:hypothetical protein